MTSSGTLTRNDLPERALSPGMPDLYPLVQLQLNDSTKAILYELQPKQLEAAMRTPLWADRAQLERGEYHKHIGFGGAAGGGKSFLARAIATWGCLKWPGINALVLRRTKGEVKKNHIKPFWQEVPDRLRDGSKLYNWNGEDLCVSFENGSDLYFGYMKEEGDELQYQGLEFDIIVFEEATHYPADQVRYLTGERMRATQPYSFPFAFYPSNPGGRGHRWYKRLFIDGDYDPELNERADDYAFVQSYVWDNQILLLKDPEYLDKLLTLPEPLRSWRLMGDWDAGEGLALPMLDRERHLIERFRVPSHWPMWGAFDWGYAHPWAFGLYAANEDGRVFKVFTVTGRRQLPHEIARSIKQSILNHGYDLSRLGLVQAGHDCWNQYRSRGEDTPQIQETLGEHGLALTRANIDRIQGLNNLRHHLAWEGRGPEGQDIDPYLMFMDEPGNRKAIKHLGSLPADPDRPEDALKQNADDYGHGGDDIYDETRYAIASRTRPAVSSWKRGEVDGWSPETLEYEAAQKMKSRMPRSLKKGSSVPEHPEFAEIY